MAQIMQLYGKYHPKRGIELTTIRNNPAAKQKLPIKYLVGFTITNI